MRITDGAEFVILTDSTCDVSTALIDPGSQRWHKEGANTKC